MRLSRRGFLGALLGAAVLDPERLLWVPGAKLISVPAPRGVGCQCKFCVVRRQYKAGRLSSFDIGFTWMRIYG